MKNHAHVSIISALFIAAVVVITEFFIHYGALALTAKGSDWGPALSFYA